MHFHNDYWFKMSGTVAAGSIFGAAWGYCGHACVKRNGSIFAAVHLLLLLLMIGSRDDSEIAS